MVEPCTVQSIAYRPALTSTICDTFDTRWVYSMVLSHCSSVHRVCVDDQQLLAEAEASWLWQMEESAARSEGDFAAKASHTRPLKQQMWIPGHQGPPLPQTNVCSSPHKPSDAEAFEISRNTLEWTLRFGRKKCSTPASKGIPETRAARRAAAYSVAVGEKHRSTGWMVCVL